MENYRPVRKKIVFIGDSHASFFSGSDTMQPAYPEKSSNTFAEFEGIRLGPVLAYSLNKTNSQFKGRENLFECLQKLNPQQHIIGLCFGEIDCRCHIVKQAGRQKITIDQAVANCFIEYNAVIDEIKSLGFQVVLWNVVPTSPSTMNNPEFPHYGTDEERVKATEAFNKVLSEKADNRSVFFLSVYARLYNGKRKDIHFFDGVHLSQSAMYYVMIELNKLFGIFPVATLFSGYLHSTKALWARRCIASKKLVYRLLKGNAVEIAV